jgi:hypothetical protein
MRPSAAVPERVVDPSWEIRVMVLEPTSTTLFAGLSAFSSISINLVEQ